MTNKRYNILFVPMVEDELDLTMVVYIKGRTIKIPFTTVTNFSMKYHLVCKVYTDVGGMK